MNEPVLSTVFMHPLRWRWYHYYFLLALFDLVVILASFLLYHSTVTSYRSAHRQLARIHAQQLWMISLRLKAIDLSAPGNNVLETRNVAEERARFEALEEKLHGLLRKESEIDEDLSEFKAHAGKMVQEERKIFDLLTAWEEPRSKALLEQATVSMAVMDRHQANALNSLAELDQLALMRQTRLLQEFGAQLDTSAAVEKYFFALVAAVLAAAFWYGRKLQRLHDTMSLEQRRFLAERSERLAAIGEVCSSVAHGIRNPLASISSSAQLLLSRADVSDAIKKKLQDILTACRRLDDRVTRLLDFASTPMALSERFDLQPVLRQAVHEIRSRLEEGGILLEQNLSDQPMRIRGERERLVQAFIEVLSNSIDHMAAGGRILVQAAVDPKNLGLAIVDVVDDGPGIPEHARAHVFDLFFTSKLDGSGIGLASVKRSVEFHGGRVLIVPAAAKGTHIQIQIPMANAKG